MPILCFERCYHYRMFLHGRLTRFASWLASTGVEKAFFFPLAFWKVVVRNPCIYANFIISNEIERRPCGFSESGRNIHLHQNVACASSNFLTTFIVQDHNIHYVICCNKVQLAFIHIFMIYLIWFRFVFTQFKITGVQIISIYFVNKRTAKIVAGLIKETAVKSMETWFNMLHDNGLVNFNWLV